MCWKRCGGCRRRCGADHSDLLIQSAPHPLGLPNIPGQGIAIEATSSHTRENLKSLTDRAVQDRDVVLVRCRRFQGIGKPEPLRYLGSDVWSRRIAQGHSPAESPERRQAAAGLGQRRQLRRRRQGHIGL